MFGVKTNSTPKNNICHIQIVTDNQHQRHNGGVCLMLEHRRRQEKDMAEELDAIDAAKARWGQSAAGDTHKWIYIYNYIHINL